MGNADHVQFFERTLQRQNGIQEWNSWRAYNEYEDPQLYRCKLLGKDLRGVDLRRAYLFGAEFQDADLREANLSGAHLRRASFERADLRGARMLGATLVETKLNAAKLDGARVHGISAWKIETDQDTSQRGLIITLDDETDVRVDDLEVAQFVYLLLNNRKIRNFMNAVTASSVLILGRFGKRKANLDAIREALKHRGYLSVLFDFDVPADRDVTDTIRTLAGLSRFIIADLTDPASIPKELEAIVPTLAVPVRPIIEGDDPPYSMFKDYWKYFWVIREPFRYRNLQHLIDSLDREVIDEAESMRVHISRVRAVVTSGSSYLSDQPASPEPSATGIPTYRDRE